LVRLLKEEERLLSCGFKGEGLDVGRIVFASLSKEIESSI